MNIDRRKLLLGTAAVAGASVAGIGVAAPPRMWSVILRPDEVVPLPEGMEIAGADESRVLGWIAFADEHGRPWRLEPVTEEQAKHGFYIRDDGTRVVIGDNDWGRSAYCTVGYDRQA